MSRKTVYKHGSVERLFRPPLFYNKDYSWAFLRASRIELDGDPVNIPFCVAKSSIDIPEIAIFWGDFKVVMHLSYSIRTCLNEDIGMIAGIDEENTDVGFPFEFTCINKRVFVRFSDRLPVDLRTKIYDELVEQHHSMLGGSRKKWYDEERFFH